MEDQKLFNMWKSDQGIASVQNPDEIISKLKNNSKIMVNDAMQMIKMKTQKLILIIAIILIGTATITDLGQFWEMAYLGFLGMGLVAYIVLSREVLFQNIPTQDMMSSIRSKIKVLKSYRDNYKVFSSVFSAGIIGLILYQVISVLPIDLELKIESGVILAISATVFIYKYQTPSDDHFSAEKEIFQLSLIFEELD